MATKRTTSIRRRSSTSKRGSGKRELLKARNATLRTKAKRGQGDTGDRAAA